MNLIKLMITFLLFCAVVLAQTLSQKYPNLSKSDIEHYEKQKELIPQIDTMYQQFESLSQEERKKLKKMIDKLMPKDMYQDLRNKDAQEFLLLFAPLMNYQAYIVIDKFSDDREKFFLALHTAKLLRGFFPTNIGFYDTYLWGDVKRDNFDLPLREYPKLLEISNNDAEIQEHYDYLLKMVQLDPKKIVKKLQQIIQNQYYTHLEYNQTKLFDELESIATKEKEMFIKTVNEVLQKHIHNEIIVYEPKQETKEEQNEFSWKLDKNKVYINPVINNETYQTLKEVLQNNSYEKIVLDLRGNEGGSINGVIDIVSAFLLENEQKILSIQEKFDTMTFTTRQNYSLDASTPLEIQIDEKTARGAMYIAAILQKNNRASVRGKSTKIDNSILSVLSLRDMQDDLILVKFQIAYSYDGDGNEFKILNTMDRK